MNTVLLVISMQLSGASWGPSIAHVSFKTMKTCKAHADTVADQLVELSTTNSTIELRKEKTIDHGLLVRSDRRVTAILRCHQIHT